MNAPSNPDAANTLMRCDKDTVKPRKKDEFGDGLSHSLEIRASCGKSEDDLRALSVLVSVKIRGCFFAFHKSA